MTERRGVGDPVRSKCTKCKRTTRHLIVALVGGEPVRVQCTACEGVHNYRPEKAAPARAPRASTGARKTTTRAQARAEQLSREFDAATAGLDPATAVPYTMTARFRPGALMAHPTFGLGLVQRFLPPATVEVLFRDGARRLRCSR